MISDILISNSQQTNALAWIKTNKDLLNAVLTYQQSLTNQTVAEFLHLKYVPITSLIK
jgi:hypothetical protein